MKRTKVVCTIGPASWEQDLLEKLIKAGMNVARLNMSHADHETHAQTIERIRQASEAIGQPIGILIDLQGPKIRVGRMPHNGIQINSDEIVQLTTKKRVGKRLSNERASVLIPVQYQEMPSDVKRGENILLNDGLMEFQVLDVEEDMIFCKVIVGGVLTSNKGINLPGTELSVSAITDKDWEDLTFAVEQNVDWIALSFVRTAEEVGRLKNRINELSSEPYKARVIAKIEKPQALDFIDEIIETADGIMVARGDLGVEIPPEKVPLVQKKLIRLCNQAGKPVITATQMLDSMIRNPRPTRAEASDVANAILDGTDALMLSGETANGKYPVESVETMADIARQVEAASLFGNWEAPIHVHKTSTDNVTDAVARATCETAFSLRAKAIITSTASGETARGVCKYRPHTPIVAVSPNPITQRQLTLSWGVIPLPGTPANSLNRVISDSIERAFKAGFVEEGQRVVLTAGVASNMPGATNLMRVELVQQEKQSEKE